MKKKCKILLVFLSLLYSCMLLGSCKSLDGKNGINGKNANIEVKDDGYIYIDDYQTEYYFVQKDCKIKVYVENAKYGSVIGEGNYSYGTGTILNAKPFYNGTFVAWKNSDGKIISKEEDLFVVADHGENVFTAVFACLPEYVDASINVKFDRETLPNATYTGKSKVNLKDGISLTFDGYNEKGLTLFTLDKETYELDYTEINKKINNNELGNGKTISYEEYIALFDERKIYYESEIDFYFYVVGKISNKYVVNISSIGSNGRITMSNGNVALSSKEYSAGTVLKLTAISEKKEVNGNLFEASLFSHWEVNGKKVSTESELIYSVWSNTNIVAHFKPKTKLSIIIKSGEDNLTASRYQDCKTPSKAVGSINGNEFEATLSYINNYAILELGYFDLGEVISLQLKLYSELRYKVAPTDYENVWKYIKLAYIYNGVRIGSGNSLIFFVPPSVNDEASLTVEYIRTTNYYSNAKDESGNSANEYLYSSDFGLLD